MEIFTNNDDLIIDKCVGLLKKGGLEIFPTETVYGIGVNAIDVDAVKSLYAKKQRSFDKPLLMHINGIEMAEQIAFLDEKARKLIKEFTPGPLTLVVKKKPCVPSEAVSGGETVGLRFPSNETFLKLSKSLNAPIAATSANISGEKSSSSFDGISDMDNVADAAIKMDGECELGLESTILSLLGETPKILRQGSFPRGKIEECIGKCD